MAVLLASLCFLCEVRIRETTHMTGGYRQWSGEAACVGARMASLKETDRMSHSRKPPRMSQAVKACDFAGVRQKEDMLAQNLAVGKHRLGSAGQAAFCLVPDTG